MKEIPLSNGGVALVDDDDFKRISQWNWTRAWRGYAQRGRRSNDLPGAPATIQMHRLVVGAARGQVVDHINRDRLDNRRANLRIATQLQNCANSPKRSSARLFKGVGQVSPCSWGASITTKGRTYPLGYYSSPEDAAHAYDLAVAQLFGEYAAFNFPDVRLLSESELQSRRRGRRKAVCKNGHDVSGGNRFHYRNGRTGCRACKRAQQLRLLERRWKNRRERGIAARPGRKLAWIASTT